MSSSHPTISPKTVPSKKSPLVRRSRLTKKTFTPLPRDAEHPDFSPLERLSLELQFKIFDYLAIALAPDSTDYAFKNPRGQYVTHEVERNPNYDPNRKQLGGSPADGAEQNMIGPEEEDIIDLTQEDPVDNTWDAFLISTHTFLQPTTRSLHPFLTLTLTSTTLRTSLSSYLSHRLTALTHRYPHRPKTHPLSGQRTSTLRKLIKFYTECCHFCGKLTTQNAVCFPETRCCKTCDAKVWGKVTTTDVKRKWKVDPEELKREGCRHAWWHGAMWYELYLKKDVERLAVVIKEREAERKRRREDERRREREEEKRRMKEEAARKKMVDVKQRKRGTDAQNAWKRKVEERTRFREPLGADGVVAGVGDKRKRGGDGEEDEMSHGEKKREMA